MTFFQRLKKTARPYRPTVLKTRYISQRGQLHIASGVENQDNAFAMLRPDVKAFATKQKRNDDHQFGAPGVYAVGVFDGHGPRGAEASSLASERMEYTVDRLLTQPDPPALEQIAKIAFQEISSALSLATCSEDSGTTASVVLVRNQDVVIANVGDSAAVLISAGAKRGSRIARYVTPMHRPTDEAEAKRVVDTGGYIREGFVVDKEATKGIAVSRTLGDRDMCEFGCISEPDIKHLKLTKDDLAIVIASDGMWDAEKLTMRSVLQSASPKNRRDPKRFCEKLLKLAQGGGGPSDDCTIASVCFT